MDDNGLQTTDTPTAQAGNKRRHTATHGVEASPAPNSSVKRAKTTHASSQAVKDHTTTGGSFSRTSQTAIFTEHSETDSSALGPRGSLQEDFLNHEPSVMFRDSGSTVADDSSAQRHMLDALNDNNTPLLQSSVVNPLPSNGPQNSSLPWSAFESNGRPGSSAGQQEPAAPDPDGVLSGAQFPAPETVAVDTLHVPERMERSTKNATSPIVEIHQPARQASASSRNSAAGSPTTLKSRKKKAEEQQFSSDLLNSDDRAVGLPRERYQPRPTKRRATAVLEEPVDLSIRPEKAAKVKRTKTADAAIPKNHEEAPIMAKIIAALAAGSTKTVDSPQAALPEEEITVAKQSADLADGSQSVDKTSKESHEDATEASKQKEDTNTVRAPEAEQAGTSSMPAPPQKKSLTKAKRAQTTIFEDHVEFVSSQRSPNLSQQQARRSRKAALKSAKNGKGQSKGRQVVSDDEDDEDTSVKDADEKDDIEPLPKKRGRGRPPKAAVKPAQKSADKVLEDSDGESETQTEMQEEPKKTSKDSRTDSASDTTSKDAGREETLAPSHLPQKQSGHPVTKDTKGTTQVTKSASTPEETQTATKIPTPSPEKENAPPKQQQQAPKGSPTSHSPIQGSSRVPLRVGLSKRQRIPSLLRVMRPPKQ